MEHSGKILVLLTATMFLFASNTFAGRGTGWQGSGGWGPGSPYSRMYDPKTIDTIRGEVVSVDRITPLRGMHKGIHLIIKTDTGTVVVHLGPDWYIERQDMKIELKDVVEVTGSRVAIEGKNVLIASEIKKGTDVLTLRDSNGFPAWAGWRRR
ncbi:MAG: DNA-binding protein [Pseudomonadota bacterium]